MGDSGTQYWKEFKAEADDSPIRSVTLLAFPSENVPIKIISVLRQSGLLVLRDEENDKKGVPDGVTTPLESA